jgi:hypothetical protein
MDGKRKLLRVSLPVVAALFMFSMLCVNEMEAAQQPLEQQGITANNKLLQFRAGNHMLGFGPNKVYLATMDHALSVEFLGTKGVTPKSGKAESSTKMNKALPLGKVTYDNLWAGISLTYKVAKGGITESVYHVAPKADVSEIRLKYNAPVELQKDGKLKIKFSKGYMTETAPIAWQEINGKKNTIDVAFRVEKGEVGFRVGKYDKTLPLIIDPTYAWHTFYGAIGNYTDYAYSIAVDNSRGDIYVLGKSAIRWTGPNGEPYLNTNATGALFILKLNSSGTYQWHTFYGSGDYDSGGKIAVDSGGNVYMSGTSYNSFSGPGGQPPLKAHGYPNYNVNFILKLNSSGGYQWHTYFEPGYDSAIAFDSNDNIYVSGYSSGHSDDFPVVPLHYSGNIIILKLDGSGTFKWITFYGYPADNRDEHGGIVIDGSDNVYVTGTSYGSWNGPDSYGVDNQTPLHAFNGSASFDIFALKLGSDGSYKWHTFYGSDSSDYAHGIALDSGGNVYITGYSNATWNGPDTKTPLNGHSGGSYDLFVLKLDSEGSHKWHTFYGGVLEDNPSAIAIDGSDNVYVTGYSYATWSGPLGQSPWYAFSGSSGKSDAVILKLNSSGTYYGHTFLGSPDYDYGQGIAVDGSGNGYITGYGAATWNGPGGEAPLNPFNGSHDIFVLKMSLYSGLTVNSSGTGVGNIESTPAGISYNYPATTTGAANYLDGSGIVIAAKADAGSKASWNGTCNTVGGTEAGNNTAFATCTISNLSATKTITATFTRYFTITAKAKGAGKGGVVSSPAGINYKYPAKKTDSQSYPKGKTVKISAKANSGYKASWNNTCKKAGGTEKGDNTRTAVCTLKVKKAATVTATFKK